jgi:hypothetical protein
MTSLVLTQDNGKRFVVGGPTQIGASRIEDRRRWAVTDRPMPEKFGELEVLICIEGCEQVSRNHAAIYREDNNYFIQDMNSLNGTRVNGIDINPASSNPQPHKLEEQDLISLAGRISFDVGFTEINNYALLIGAGEDHAGAMGNTINALQRQLRRRGYEVHYLLGDVSKQDIRDKLEEFQTLCLDDSQFFFSYHGHGSAHGLSAGGQVISPRDLYKEIGKLQGDKVVFLDACNAGIFVDEHVIPRRTFVMAGSGVDRRAGETRMPGELGRLRENNYIARFSNALVQYLENNDGELNLTDFYQSIDGTNMSNLAMQEPQMGGSEQTVPDRVTQYMTRTMIRD